MQILFKRGNTASNDGYTGQLGEITIDTQTRKIRVHDGVKAGGHPLALTAEISGLQSQINALDIADISGLQAALDGKVDESITITAGNGMTGGGDLSANRTVTLGTPGTITGATTNGVTATSHTHAITVTKSDVGLDNVDNTSDLSKPISTATQTALNAKVDDSEKGVANGVATLDSGGKVPTSQLPDSVLGQMEYIGTWNATTNTPTIPTAASGNKGNYYKVSVNGSTNIGGITDWKVGDWIVSNGSSWDKIDNTDSVSSVAGRTGAIVLTTGDITDMTATGISLATAASKAAAQQAIDVEVGVDVQPYNANILTIKNNLTAGAAPTVNDDSGDGYAVGSKWIDTTNDKFYICVDATIGAAVWNSGQGVQSLSVTGPIVNSGTTNEPIIAIQAASGSNAGSMSSAHWSKLEGIAAGAQVNTVDSVAGKTGVVTLVKSDVGLGNVDNFLTSSQAQAQAATANNVFMTPLRTKELIEAGNFTIDLGTF